MEFPHWHWRGKGTLDLTVRCSANICSLVSSEGDFLLVPSVVRADEQGVIKNQT